MEHHVGRLIDHVQLRVADLEKTKRFYRAALPAGERDYHAGYYGAFAFDPEGNNIEAVYHGPSKRSAESVVVTG
jgi:catechol 2,3-dioxygenase-like lactoylglutathione lyase family enzyme